MTPTKTPDCNRRGKASFAPAAGSALANRIADALMEGWQGFYATRLQLRGPEEQDMGGLCRSAVVRVIDKELDADALARSKPALFRKIRRILKAPNAKRSDASDAFAAAPGSAK